MLPNSNVRKKPIEAATITRSRNSSNKSTSSEAFSLVDTQSSEDDGKSNKIVYQTSIKKLSRLAKPSKSETIPQKQQPINAPLSPQHHQLAFRTRLAATKSNENSKINNQQRKNNKRITIEEEKLAEKLKSTFKDLIDSSPKNQSDNADIVDLIRSQYDTQTVRIRRLERALKEKEDQRPLDDDEGDETTLSFLLKRYPRSMDLYRKQIQEDQYNQQLEACIEQFEVQKQRMIEEHQKNFDVLKLKYRSRFDDIVERMISDPSRLDDEWARRVRKEADDRVEAIRRKYTAGRE